MPTRNTNDCTSEPLFKQGKLDILDLPGRVKVENPKNVTEPSRNQIYLQLSRPLPYSLLWESQKNVYLPPLYWDRPKSDISEHGQIKPKLCAWKHTNRRKSENNLSFG